MNILQINSSARSEGSHSTRLANELASSIAERVRGAAFTILRSESGILPMGPLPFKRPKNGTYIKAGLTAGGLRPSTGYAFQRIQKWAKICAERLAVGGPPVGHAADPWTLCAMDRIFLAVLRAQPVVWAHKGRRD